MRHNLADIPPLRKADKLCAVLLAGAFLAPHLVCWGMDAAAIRAADVKADKPPTITITAPTIDFVPLLEAVEAHREELYWEAVPLDQECRDTLQEACSAHGVPVCDVLGLIEVESGFDPNADNGLCYGYTGLNRNYYPPDLTPAENIRAGVSHLAGQIERYGGDIQAALRGYNKGWDDGDRRYARAVLAASEKWGCG